MNQRQSTHRKIRTTVIGNATRPRLAIYRSLNNLFAQIIDDSKKTTLVSASSLKMKGSLTEKAKAVAEDVATKAKAKKIAKVVFDRGGFPYQGVVKILAETAREKGLEF